MSHAGQFNQHTDNQAMNAANLAREQRDLLEHYLSVALRAAMRNFAG